MVLPSAVWQNPAQNLAMIPTPPQTAGAKEAKGVQAALAPASKRVVYVLHSGMRDPGNDAAKSLQAALLKRGIRSEDILIMPAVYPTMVLDPSDIKFGQGVRTNLRTFNQSANPDSLIAKKAYQDFTKTMKDNGVKPGDQVVWVGDSAGGQMGFTVSKMLADNVDNKNGQKLQFDTIVTLGSPIAKNQVSKEVKVRHYTSESDLIQHGRFLGGLVGKPIPENLDSNDRVRYFKKIGHLDWYKDNDPAIVDRIVTETQPGLQQPWRLSGLLSSNPGVHFGGLMRSALDEKFLHTFEDNKGVKTPNNASTIHIFGKDISVIKELNHAYDASRDALKQSSAYLGKKGGELKSFFKRQFYK